MPSYEYAIGSVRAREANLLTRQELDSLASMHSVGEIFTWLQAKGYAEGASVDQMLENRRLSVWDYLDTIAPDRQVFFCFWIQNDIHNLKTIMKGTLAQRSYDSLLLAPSVLDADVLKKAVENQKFSDLPDWLAQPAEQAYAVLAHTGDARACDAILDRACMAQMLAEADASGSDFLQQYISAVVFFTNIKIALRLIRIDASPAVIKEALCDVDGLDKNTVAKEAAKGEKALCDYLSRLSVYDCNKVMPAYEQSGAAFEREVDNALLRLTEQCRTACEGASPMLGYLLNIEAEIKAIHIITSSVATGLTEQQTKERLRTIHG